MSDDASPGKILDALDGLADPQLEALLLRLGQSAYISSAQAAPAQRRTELARWAGAPGNRARMEAELRNIAGALPDPAGWIRYDFEQQARLQVLGLRAGDARYEMRLDDLLVDVELLHETSARTQRLADFGGPRSDALDDARSLPDALRAVASRREEFGLRGVVLVGLPGSGKTTLLRKRFVEDARGAERRPVLLRFSTLQDLGSAALEPRALERWADRESERAGFPGAGRGLLADRGGRFRFLLDGYDELASRAERRAVAVWLAEEVGLWPGADFVVTTRKAAWDADDHAALARVFAPYVLLRLRDTAAVDYVRRWFPLMVRRELDPAASEDAVRRATEAAAEQAEALIRDVLRTDDADARDRVAPFVGNPLLLSIVCLVFRQWGRLPRRRGELYRECFEVLVRGRARPDGTRSGFDPAVGRTLLGPLAWDMQETAEAVDSPKEVSRAVVLDHLRRASDYEPALRGQDPEATARVVREECGLLVSPDGEHHAFPHLTFQEYLAFEHARAHSRAGEIAARAGDDRWREPILLGMSDVPFQLAFFEALLSRPGAVAAQRELLAACRRESEPRPEPFVAAMARPPRSWWRRLLGDPGAGAPLMAADLAVILGLFRTDPPGAIREAARSLVEHPDATVRMLAQELAGVAATDRRRRTVEAGIEFVWVEPGEFLMGATNERGRPGFDPQAVEDEAPPHRVRITTGFWLGRFPVTNAQYRRFVAAAEAEEPASFRQPGFDDPDMPVTSVSHEDAMTYCTWASTVAGARILLPTEGQWEYVARGPEGRRYPWGDAPPSQDRCWSRSTGEHSGAVRGPARVGERPSGAGPFGAEEQAGNV